MRGPNGQYGHLPGMQDSVYSFNFIDIYVYIVILFSIFSILSTDLTIVSYYVIFPNRGDVWKPGNPLVKPLFICSNKRLPWERERPIKSP